MLHLAFELGPLETCERGAVLCGLCGLSQVYGLLLVMRCAGGRMQLIRVGMLCDRCVWFGVGKSGLRIGVLRRCLQASLGKSMSGLDQTWRLGRTWLVVDYALLRWRTICR